MSSYKPTEHGGMKADGTPDKRVKVGGQQNEGTEKYKPTEHDGMKEDGTPDRRTKMGQGARE
ncbi:hypothetical protein M427DRAFT_291292 [Gonapodya prolifera JEL478]|uniref:Uncharacterized protein n=1 Tax=Gonapodya prolifera (strain JEL478) TaxID=1344416 RepID=A0A139AJB0_GONPJ|nr:hypothetical protein M427DRAFT_291292 [Gonapodya prolifera JEL478]|eukprot:KXS16495.1 hypothetical protein M427DRAFT_291292 [Gonapodya prolifera JEL478]